MLHSRPNRISKRVALAIENLLYKTLYFSPGFRTKLKHIQTIW